MKLALKNPIVFFDLETTGTNIVSDRIVEIAYLKIYPNGNEESKRYLVNPEMPIPQEVTAIHGISDEDVKNEPVFKELAKIIAKDIEGCDLAGYNSVRFDLPLLAEEFLRANVDIDLNQSEYKVGDSFKLNVNLNTDHYSVYLYVILAYLNGYFQSVVSTQCFSRVNHAVPYHKNIGGAEAQTFSVLDEVLTVGHPSGEYAYYGIAVKTGTDPLDVKNWLDFDWKNYTLR